MPTIFIRADYVSKRVKQSLIESLVIWPHDSWFKPDNIGGISARLRKQIEQKINLPAGSFEITEISIHISKKEADQYRSVLFNKGFTRADYFESRVMAAYELQQETIQEFLAESGD